MSSSWFLVSIYLIRILVSKLIVSNNHSKAALWILETCLIVGLLPLIIILITASLSSNTLQQSFLMRKLDVWGNKVNIIQNIEHSSRLHVILITVNNGFSPVFQESESCFQGLKQSEPINQVRVSIQPQSCVQGMISDSVELCETEVCFLHIQLVGTNVWLP